VISRRGILLETSLLLPLLTLLGGLTNSNGVARHGMRWERRRMEKWEYLSANGVWEAEVEQWSVNTSTGVTARGKNLGAALNIEGEHGWELVSLVAVKSPHGEAPDWYRAVFKRHKQPTG
jgi:hypothetical protein